MFTKISEQNLHPIVKKNTTKFPSNSIFLYYSGLPSSMDDIQFNNNLNAAWDLMEDEANRTRANFQPNTATAAEP